MGPAAYRLYAIPNQNFENLGAPRVPVSARLPAGCVTIYMNRQGNQWLLKTNNHNHNIYIFISFAFTFTFLFVSSDVKFSDRMFLCCLLYTSDAADDLLCVDFGG